MINIFSSELKSKQVFLLKVMVLAGLYLTTMYSYLLFHTLAEIFSIVVAFSLFIITLNSRKYINNQYLLIIGIAYLFISFLDLLHTLAYHGMNIFTDYDYYANQLWIATRCMESLTLLFAFFMLGEKRKVNLNLLLLIYFISTALIILTVFTWKIFPVCFIEGAGQTPFKITSEYIICAILFVALVFLKKSKNNFEEDIYRLIFWSIIFTMISELAFAFYISNYGFSNIAGHYFKIFSYYLIYKAIIQTGIIYPYELIFRELGAVNSRLNAEIAVRKSSELEKEKLIIELEDALSRVKKLGGLLPICAHCKKIRDDKGYWNQLESYISTHSEADFSHSICPDCEKKFYPEFLHDNKKNSEKSN